MAENIERYLIEHCSPTLASVKAANLFNAVTEDDQELAEQVKQWNRLMNPKGVKLLVLRNHGRRALVYVYREKKLQEKLDESGVAGFLEKYGYTSTDAGYALNRLVERFSGQEEFPHEIGIFLDYPLGDVIGFIKNSGQNYKGAGCWKVYCNECETMKLFHKYRKCRNIYRSLWQNGRSVVQLTVAGASA